jgi:hypothetical protein
MRVQAMCERLVAHVCKFMLMRLVNLMKLSTSDYKVFFLRSMAVVLDAFYQTSLHAEIGWQGEAPGEDAEKKAQGDARRQHPLHGSLS